MRTRLGCVLALLVLACAPATASAAGPAPRIDVLSNRADVLSGGDALVAIGLTKGLKASKVTVRLRGRNVTSTFALRPNGRFEGLLTGLRVGSNVLTASAPGRRTARITLVNHANGGPAISGPQVTPWTCENGSKDPKCEQAPTYEYQYRSSVDNSFHPYDPKSPPPDVATTTTQTGTTVPFIIRIETGYQDRDQYKIATLFQPGKPWKPWAPQPQFNHKLLITHGASCGIDHESADAPSVTGDTVGVPGAPAASSSSPTAALGEGYAVMSTALDNA